MTGLLADTALFWFSEAREATSERLQRLKREGLVERLVNESLVERLVKEIGGDWRGKLERLV